MKFNLWDILILVSLSQGFLFGLLIFFSRKFKSIANRYLATSILSITIIGANEWFSGWNFDDQYYLIDFLGDDIPWVLFFYVPMLLFFMKSISHPKATRKLFISLSFPFLWFIILNLLINFDVDFHFYSLPAVKRIQYFTYAVEYYFALLYALILSGVALKFIKNSKIVSTERKWLMGIWRATFLLILFWLILTFIPDVEGRYEKMLNYIHWGGISLFIYWLIFQGIYHFRLSGKSDTDLADTKMEGLPAEQDNTEKNNSPLFQREHEIFERMSQLMKTQQLYRDPNLSRDIMAEQLGISAGYLSKVISTVTIDNFSGYVSKLRVEEVKRLLVDSDYAPYSLLAIGMEAGFKSKTAFYTTFKKYTGMTPSEYKKSSNSSSFNN